MSHSRLRIILTMFAAIGGLAALTGLSGAQEFVNYDNFNAGPLIDPEKWHGSSVEGDFGQPSTEWIRMIEGGQLHLALVSYGNNTSDTGTAGRRQGLSMRDLGTIGGSRFIIGMKAVATVLDAEIQDCPTNPDSTSARARAQLIGSYFNDNTGPGADDATGDIAVQFQLQKDPDANRITATLLRCAPVPASQSCAQASTFAMPGNPVTFDLQWSVNTPVILKLAWQKAAHRFKLQATSAGVLETKFIDYTGHLDDSTALRGFDFKQVRVNNTADNCLNARKRALMDVLFDNVKVKRDP
jgi:hypothetical protein